jgi:hypothetical protein
MAGSDVDPSRVQTRSDLAAALTELLSGRSSRDLEKALKDQHEADRRANVNLRRQPRPLAATAGKTTINEISQRCAPARRATATSAAAIVLFMGHAGPSSVVGGT